jgi:esterase/lipase superfamily enzyme
VAAQLETRVVQFVLTPYTTHSVMAIEGGVILIMRTRFVAALSTLFFACALGSNASCAQPSTAIVEQSLRSLIAELQSKIERQKGGDKTVETIDPILKDLGSPDQILLSTPAAAQGLFNYRACVVFPDGGSQWSLGVLETGRIVHYEFAAFSSAWGSTCTPPETHGYGGTIIVPPFQPSPPDVDSRIVEFLFATTRQSMNLSPAKNASYSGERGPLTFGAASVRIPDDHKIGRIELPSSWSLFGLTLSTAPDEHKHFIIKRVVSLSEDALGQVIRAKGAKTALVFVHGFNTTFEDALYRNAQIVWDLQYQGLSVLFTWASRGELTDYVYDKESAYLARDSFIALLQKLKREYGIEQIIVLAHSMGNLIALDALANDAQTSDPVKIARLVMAAPDVDSDQFKVLAPEAKAIVGGMTLYVSSADRAMALSRRLAGGIPRAGDVPAGGPIILPNVETIDVTAVGDDIFGLNHNAFAASRDVMEDISAMFRLNLPSPRLAQIRAVPQPPAPPRYWKFVR